MTAMLLPPLESIQVAPSPESAAEVRVKMDLAKDLTFVYVTGTSEDDSSLHHS